MPNTLVVKSCVSFLSFELRWGLHPDLSSESKLRLEKGVQSQGDGNQDRSHDSRWAGEGRRHEGGMREEAGGQIRNLVCSVVKRFAINCPNASGISWLEPIKNIF